MKELLQNILQPLLASNLKPLYMSAGYFVISRPLVPSQQSKTKSSARKIIRNHRIIFTCLCFHKVAVCPWFAPGSSTAGLRLAIIVCGLCLTKRSENQQVEGLRWGWAKNKTYNVAGNIKTKFLIKNPKESLPLSVCFNCLVTYSN